MLGAASNRESIGAIFHVRCWADDRGDERTVIQRWRCLAQNPSRSRCRPIVLFPR